jgi:hypothetical protein
MGQTRTSAGKSAGIFRPCALTKTCYTKVTLVPTYDGDQLRQFFVANKIRLAELNINILPAATRCNVQYDDEGSPAQRLRFSVPSHSLNEQ